MKAAILAVTFLATPCMAASFQETRLAAEQGRVQAQEDLGTMYAQGKGVARDFGAAVRWWERAAAQEDAEAQYNLAIMYALGKGVPQDEAQAVELCRIAAEHGSARAQYYLGLLYSQGKGVPHDHRAAHKWYSLAAAQGHKGASTLRDAVKVDIPDQQVAGGQKAILAWKADSATAEQ